MTNNSRNDDRRWLVPPLNWKLSEAGDVAEDYGSGRSAVGESGSAEGCVSRRAVEDRGAGSDHFFDVKPGMLHGLDDFHQSVVAAMGQLFALLERRRFEMTVVIMKASERQVSTRDGASHFQNCREMILLNAGAVHTGINVDENPYAAALPLSCLRRIFGKDGDLDVRVLSGQLADAEGVASDYRIGQKNISKSGCAGG